VTSVIKVDGAYRIVRSGKATEIKYLTRLDAERELAEAQEWMREQAIEAGMLHGVRGYNNSMGCDLGAPDPCGHQCDWDCPRCGEDLT
jgi:hypothetical protein